MTYLHGVETIEVAKGLRPVMTPPTCVIALVGIAPNFLGENTKGKPTIVTNHIQAAKFGPDVNGYTIPNALKRILAYGSAQVIVVDVFDPERHTKDITGETVVIGEDGRGKLTNPGVTDLVLTLSGATLTEGTDYRVIAATGQIERIRGGAIAPGGATLTANYTCADFTLITSADIIGAVNESGEKTGLKALYDAPNTLGVKPRIIIAPGFGTAGSACGTAMIEAAEKLRAHAYLDVPLGVTVEEAIQGRGESGVVNLGTSSQRAVLCYPYVKVLNDNEELVLEPMSQHLAGLASYVDTTEGYWVSISNNEFLGVIGLEQPVMWELSDPNCEANRLNALGITTSVRPHGGGFKAWGNRSAAFPQETHPLNFVCVRVVADLLHEAVEKTLLRWVDKPLTGPTLDSARESILAYLDKLTNQGAILGGSFSWPAEDNPEAELALGHATYVLSFLPPTPLERVTVRSEIDTAWLRTI